MNMSDIIIDCKYFIIICSKLQQKQDDNRHNVILGGRRAGCEFRIGKKEIICYIDYSHTYTRRKKATINDRCPAKGSCAPVLL